MSASDYSVERSLLQKAVRRGNEGLTEKVVKYLISIGDLGWLRKRLAVIAYEECWTIGDELQFDINEFVITEEYKKLARTVKNKNAAGLASLAHYYGEGNERVLFGKSEDEKNAITSIANAMNKNSVSFWDWVYSESGYDKNMRRIDLAREHISKAVFPTDKAQMFAAAYFCVKGLVPETKYIQPNNDPDFPYWIAFDKHTDIGKDLFIEASNKIDLLPSRGMWLAFYFEGSICNQLIESPYWTHLVNWGIERMEMNMTDAEKIWNDLKPIIMDLMKTWAEELKERINKPIPKDDSQLSFF